MDSPLGYPCETRLLPFSAETRAEIDRLAEHYQSSLDWNDPGGPSPWTAQECEAFDSQAEALLGRIRSELPVGWVIEDRFSPVGRRQPRARSSDGTRRAGRTAP
jgi:hypothetical protein